MAKKKDDTSGLDEGTGVAGTGPGEIQEPALLETIEQATEFAKRVLNPPEGTKVVYVTSDKNIFLKENQSEAVNHSINRKLQIFEVIWD